MRQHAVTYRKRWTLILNLIFLERFFSHQRHTLPYGAMWTRASLFMYALRQDNLKSENLYHLNILENLCVHRFTTFSLSSLLHTDQSLMHMEPGVPQSQRMCVPSLALGLKTRTGGGNTRILHSKSQDNLSLANIRPQC